MIKRLKDYILSIMKKAALFLIYLTTAITLITAIPNLALSENLDEELEKVQEEIQEVQEEYDDVSGDLSKIKSRMIDIKNSIDNLSSKSNITQTQIITLTNQITSLSSQISNFEALLERFRKVLEDRQIQRNATLRAFYKRTHRSSLEILFSTIGFLDITQKSAYYKSYVNETVNTIKKINGEMVDYNNQKKEVETAKKDLEKEQARFLAIKADLEIKKAKAQSELGDLGAEASALEDQITNLTNELSGLTSKQQDILRAKFGASEERLTVGDFEESKQSLPDPGFSPAYAFFTRGYPHRVGMNQYGAKGRAKDGQSWEEILSAYYPNTKLTGECDDEEIDVQGYGSMSLEEYLYGLGEMPSSWPMNALKAQAVAARSYALTYKERGQAICTTQSCQVYLGYSKGGSWETAVNETCGMYLENNGSPITAWYASTAGGYTRSSADVWGGHRPWAQRLKDASCDDWESCSFDGPKYGNSPWFHKAWGKGTKSGPWMTKEQAQDIFNAYLLVEKDSGYTSDLSPADQGGIGENEVIEKLEDEGITQVGQIEKIEVYDDGEGYTTKVVLYSENYDGKEFDGYEFRSIFNLRAPGTIVIWTSFFDILRE